MPFTPPTLEQCIETVTTRLEFKTGQSVPWYEKAMKHALSIALGYLTYPLYKYASYQRKQCLALTADDFSIEFIHAPNEGLSRGGYKKCEVRVSLLVSNNSNVSVTTSFINDVTGLYYFPKEDKYITNEDNTIDLIAEKYGTEYSLIAGESILRIETQIDGIGSECNVDEVLVFPQDKESIESLKGRILSSRYGAAGGNSAYSYRALCQSIDGVSRVFPFSGRPDNPTLSLPGDRSVFIEAISEYGTDGIASEELLENVRSIIRIDPDTGYGNESLGDTDNTLYISSISHVLFSINISGLKCAIGVQQSAKNAAGNACSLFLRSLCPFVPGCDAEYDKKDTVSSGIVSEIVSKTLKGYSATFSSLTITSNGITIVDRQLIGGELARLDGVVTWS